MHCQGMYLVPTIQTSDMSDDQFRQVVSGFAQKEIAPRAAEIDRTNRMPEVRFFALTVTPDTWLGCQAGLTIRVMM